MNEIQSYTNKNISSATSTTLLATPSLPKSMEAAVATTYDSDHLDSVELARDSRFNPNKRNNKQQAAHSIENEHSPLVLVEKESKRENSPENLTKPKVKSRVRFLFKILIHKLEIV